MKHIIFWSSVLVLLAVQLIGAKVGYVAEPPTPTPITPVPAGSIRWPVTMSTNLIGNAYFEQDDFGLIDNWSVPPDELQRWYLVQDVPPDQPGTKWTDRVDLSAEGRGSVLRSIDHQDCNYFCSSEAIQIVPADPNTFYVLSAYARVVEGPSPALYLDFLDENYTRLDVHTQGGYGATWARQIVAATSPPGTRYIGGNLYMGNAQQGTVYWDNIALHSLSAPLMPVYGLTNVAAEKPIIAHGGGIDYGSWNDATDYASTTRPMGGHWGHQTNMGTYQTVDLGRVYTLEGVGYWMDWDSAYRNPLTMQIDVSVDNVNWTMAAQIIHQPAPQGGYTWVEASLTLTPIEARYVRYAEPDDGEWNGWGNYFFLAAYARTAQSEPSATPSAIFTPSATPLPPPSPQPEPVPFTNTPSPQPTTTAHLPPPPTSGPTRTPTPGCDPLRGLAEVLTVDFNQVGPTYTEYLYSGEVTLVLEGTGQAAGTASSDAFYLYTDDAGNPLPVPQTEMFDLEIDGQRAIYTLGLLADPPPFNPNHLYAVRYDVGPVARRIAFRVSDLTTNDNAGAFRITIIPAP